jgi:hypothetical protein
MIDTPQIPHNRTFLVFGRDLVVLCSDCAANKDRLRVFKASARRSARATNAAGRLRKSKGA